MPLRAHALAPRPGQPYPGPVRFRNRGELNPVAVLARRNSRPRAIPVQETGARDRDRE